MNFGFTLLIFSVSKQKRAYFNNKMEVFSIYKKKEVNQTRKGDPAS